MEETLKLGNRIAVVHEGKLEQVGSSKEIVNQPKTPFVEELFVGKNLDAIWFRTFLTTISKIPVKDEIPVIQNFSQLLELIKVRKDNLILFQFNHCGYQTTFSAISKELKQW